MSKRSANIRIRTCCICLKANSSLDELTSENENPWSALYSFCFGVKMDGDGIPRKICSSCQVKLKDFSKFKELALKSYKLWQCVIKADHTNLSLQRTNDTPVKNNCDDDDFFDGDYTVQVGTDNTVNDDLVDNLENSWDTTDELKCTACDIKFESETSFKDHIKSCAMVAIDFHVPDSVNVSKSSHQELSTDPQINGEEPIAPKRRGRGRPKKNVESKNSIMRKKFVRKRKAAKRSTGDSDYEYGDYFINEKSKKSKKAKCITNSLKSAPVSYDCGLCKDTFSESSDLKQHLTDHSNNNDMCCTICDFVGRDFADMVYHRLSHLSTKYRTENRCHLCDKKFYNPMKLPFHYRSQHLNKKGGWCKTCNKVYTNFNKWRMHEALHDEQRYVCDLCDKSFKCRNEVKDHLNSHDSRQKFVCELCGYIFHKKYNLKIHLLGRHTVNKVKCNHCNKIFKNELSLAEHITYVNSEKPYQCDICLKYYKTPAILRRHKVFHMEERKFICKVCGGAYKTLNYLKEHEFIHSRERMFKCDQCSKSFLRAGLLRRHASVHTGIRLYQCKLCPRSFNGRSLLFDHLSKRHNVDPTESEQLLKIG